MNEDVKTGYLALYDNDEDQLDESFITFGNLSDLKEVIKDAVDGDYDNTLVIYKLVPVQTITVSNQPVLKVIKKFTTTEDELCPLE